MIINRIKIELRPMKLSKTANVSLVMEVKIEGKKPLVQQKILIVDDLTANFDIYLDQLFKRVREEFRMVLKGGEK